MWWNNRTRLHVGDIQPAMDLRTKFRLPNVYKLVHSLQETHFISYVKASEFVFFRGSVAVYCEAHTEHTDTLCGQNVELLRQGMWCI
jgi:hypothetical protein